jgi:hypothetical protein
MLRFTVNHPLPDPTTNRFVALVNRLLPNGWRFSISPMPRLVDAEDPLGLGPAMRPVLMPGFGALARWDQFGTLETHAEAWKRRFRESLTALIGPPRTSDFELMAEGLRSDQIFGDSYFLGVLDVADLERMPPVGAAAALVHALQESSTREVDPTIAGFQERHDNAIAGMEAQVMGGRRLEAEVLTRPRGINLNNPPSGTRYQAWVPYQTSNGSIRAVVLTMRERTVLASRMAGFQNIAAFRSTVPT